MKNISLKRTALLGVGGVMALATVLVGAVPVAADDCVHASPTTDWMVPSGQPTYPGETTYYTFSVRNNDTVGCDSSTITSNIVFVEGDITASLTPVGPVTVAPQTVVETTVMVTALATALPGEYPLLMQTIQEYSDGAPFVGIKTNFSHLVLETPPPADTVAPTVSVLNPADGAVLPKQQTVSITATASDNVGVIQMDYKVNGTILCSGGPTLTSCDWKPTKKGTYTLAVTAHDGGGNSSTASVTVQVK